MDFPSRPDTAVLASYQPFISSSPGLVLKRNPTTTINASPTPQQGVIYTADPPPTGCERVGYSYIRCLGDEISPYPLKALAKPYNNTISSVPIQNHATANITNFIPLRASTSAHPLNNCIHPSGLNRLACGEPTATIGFFILLSLSFILLSIAAWLVLKTAHRPVDEDIEKRPESPPGFGGYQSASKLRLKERVRSMSSLSSASTELEKAVVIDRPSCHSTLPYSRVYVPEWRAAKMKLGLEERMERGMVDRAPSEECEAPAELCEECHNYVPHSLESGGCCDGTHLRERLDGL